MKIKGAILKEQKVKFAIVETVIETLKSRADMDLIKQKFSPLFGNIPVIFMAKNVKGVPVFIGRKDIVDFLSNNDISRIPWREFTS
ncbi:hypothetical protein MHK_010940 [Candidatus Magnetomorum sp. HK-1]|nr:hypothetical protein MHK_010940 [Candidatus Magnetomorum sp. HK-1]